MWQRQKSKTFELFFTPRFPFFFILGALTLAVMGNSLYDLLKKQWGDDASSLRLILAFSVVAICSLWVGAYYAGAWQKRLAGKRELAGHGKVVGKQSPEKRKGLIAYVSRKQREHLEKAISYHASTLERVWLIATAEARKLAEEIMEDYDDPPKIRIEVVPLSDEFDFKKAQAVVDGIYRTRLDGLSEEDVTADFTGGTKPMTAGMIFACLGTSRKLQYVPADYTEPFPKPLDPIEFAINGSEAEASKG